MYQLRNDIDGLFDHYLINSQGTKLPPVVGLLALVEIGIGGFLFTKDFLQHLVCYSFPSRVWETRCYADIVGASFANCSRSGGNLYGDAVILCSIHTWLSCYFTSLSYWGHPP